MFTALDIGAEDGAEGFEFERQKPLQAAAAQIGQWFSTSMKEPSASCQ